MLRAGTRAMQGAALLLLALLAASLFTGSPAARADTPANDEWPGTTISGLPYAQIVDTSEATRGPHDSDAACTPALAGTVWWNITPEKSANYTVHFETDGFVPWLKVSTNNPDGPTEHYCAPAVADVSKDAPPTTNDFSFPAEPGVIYHIELGGASVRGEPDRGVATFRLTETPPPSNDKIGSARKISLPFQTTVDIMGATAPADEPQSKCLHPNVAEVAANTVWYRYTPADDKAIKILLDSPTIYRFAALWTGTPDSLKEVACGIDLGAQLQGGQKYFIQVGISQFLPNPRLLAAVGLRVEQFDVPDCPPKTNEFADPTGDALSVPGNPSTPSRWDLLSATGAVGADVTCISFSFNEPLPSDDSYDTAPFTWLYIDTDRNGFTGGPSPSVCNDVPAMGIESYVRSDSVPNLVADVEDWSQDSFSGNVIGQAIRILHDRSITFVIPAESIGNSQHFDLFGAMLVDGSYDCTTSDYPLTFGTPEAAAFGDIDCNGGITLVDALHLMRDLNNVPDVFAGGCPRIRQPLPASYSDDNATHVSGDVDCDSSVTQLDTLALLKAAAGLPPTTQASCPTLGAPPLSS